MKRMTKERVNFSLSPFNLILILLIGGERRALSLEEDNNLSQKGIEGEVIIRVISKRVIKREESRSFAAE